MRQGAPATLPLGRRSPRLGFLGVGWIGRSRMRALLASGAGTAAAIADPDANLRSAAALDAPEAVLCEDLDGLLGCDVGGIVIATPSALHAEQAVAALAAGLPVFCQKPLGRDAAEAEAVVAAAKRAGRLLGVDLSYRFTASARAIEQRLAAGAIGEPYLVELVFHNAYGPDKPWFKRRDLAGGGCLIDLGTHLVDLALWLTGAHGADVVASHILRAGRPLPVGTQDVEDHVLADLRLDNGVLARIACSWWLDAGRDCIFEVVVRGSEGALAMRNRGGSFYDFDATLMRGTAAELLASPPDDWGGRALEDWTRRLSRSRAFDSSAEEVVAISQVIDAIYEAAR